MSLEAFIAIWFTSALLSLLFFTKYIGAAKHGTIVRAMFFGPITLFGMGVGVILDLFSFLRNKK